MFFLCSPKCFLLLQISDVCSCDTTICLAINPYVHFLEGGAEVMDGVARSSHKLKEIIESVARSSHKIKRSEIAKALAEEENDVVECSSEATWMSTESTSEVVEEVESEVVTEVEVEKEVKKEVEKKSYSVLETEKEVEKESKERENKPNSHASASPHSLNKGVRIEKEVEIEEEVEVENSPMTTSSPIAADGKIVIIT